MTDPANNVCAVAPALAKAELRETPTTAVESVAVILPAVALVATPRMDASKLPEARPAVEL